MMHELRFQDRKTAVHRLHAVVKLAWGAAIIILCLIYDHPVFLLSLSVVVALLLISAGVWREWSVVLKLGLWLGASIIVINALVSYHGNHVLAVAPFTLPVLGRPAITLEAIAYGAGMAVKLLTIISAFAFINLTVHPDDIMLVLLKLKLPYKSVLVTSLSLRFIPCLVDDVQRINDAYRTRGVRLDTGSRFGKIKKRAVIIIPLLSNSLDRAVQVAEAMEARAFGSGKERTFYRDIRLSRTDGILALSVLLPLGAGTWIRFSGHGSADYYPDLALLDFSGPVFLMAGILAALLLVVLPLARIRKGAWLD